MTASKSADSYAVLLHAHGLRATPQRLQVLDVLAHTSKPMSITELQKKLSSSAKNASVDTVTLYRSLETLVGKALVRPVDLRHGHTDYEFVQEGKHHHHLICESCGLVEDFAWCPNEKLQKEILTTTSHFAKLTDHALEFFGVCAKCASKLKNSKK